MDYSKIKKSHIIECLIHLAIWTVYFVSINVNWSDEWFNSSKNASEIAPIPVIIFPLFFYFNAFYLIPKYLKNRLWFRYVFLLAVTIFSIELFRILIYSLFSNESISFLERLTSEFNSNDNLIFGKLNPLISSLQVSFAYRFTRDWIVNNDLIDKLKTEKLQMELSVLKAQINPHFLFNNLNALDDLIDRDPKRAKTYLNKLSKMYRYTLTSMDNDVVSLIEEWAFIDDYIYLLSERYGESYVFTKTLKIKDTHKYLIPPTSLQLLIENAVKHNLGNIKNPLEIKIEIDKNKISVKHHKRLKKLKPEGTGKGLRNIQERFKLLSEMSIEIIDTDNEFSVNLPLIKNIRIS